MNRFAPSCILGVMATAFIHSGAGVLPASAQMRAHGGTALGGAAAGAPTPAAATPAITGKVVETMNASTYTYVLVDDGTRRVWAAGPQTTVAVGDTVSLPAGMPMQNFRSSTLGRTFDVVFFVPAIQVTSGAGAAAGNGKPGAAAAPAGDGHPMPKPAPAVDLANIPKAEGGQTVAELYANKATLAGKDVVVRGRVVKYNAGIMGKNWLHVQDGSGAAGTNDVTVTTTDTAAVGNTVLVRGKLATDRDLGAGYKYAVLIDNAAVTVE